MASRCPQCNRFTVNYDPREGTEKCFAIDCSWRRENNITSSNYNVTVPLNQNLTRQPNHSLAIQPQKSKY